ncbi:MAG: peptidoglycan DD-metalloendopeptidase family protein [Flavobacterium sp.]|nr:peptidoglycan DD-metalloendopeptidase family protein [Flavobacterium sp.]
MPRILFSLIFILFTGIAFSQSQQEKLEARKAQIQREIAENQKFLQTVRSKEKTATNELILQKKKIQLKETLINTTEKQRRLVENDMYINQVKINRLNKELDDLREDYAEMIRKSYKSRSMQSRAMFLLSSENFLQAYKRAQYMKQYTSYRKTQGEEIKKKAEELQAFNQKLNVQKAEKERLIEENRKERETLEKERQEQQKLINDVLKDKKKITAEIKKRQQEAKNIDRQIDKLIREAIAAANRKTAAEAAKAKGTSTAAAKAATKSVNKIVLTPEGQLIANNFRANKGKLPWPTEKGFISLGYGDQAHPVHKSLVVHNSGLEISTEPGADARAVFGGEVSSIMVISPVNKAVMIQHGDYFTIYQNLSTVNVQKGDKVTTKQKLGKIRTNGDTGKTTLKFLVLQNTVYSNPQTWLAPM